MFNVGGGEVLVILLIALVVLGPEKLPEYTRKAARVMGELRRLSQGFQNEMRQAMELDPEPLVRPSTTTGPRLVEPPHNPVESGAGGGVSADGEPDASTGDPSAA
jgi:sec-independent protein translocase protein TatB